MNNICQKRLRNDPELPRLRGSIREPRLMPRGDYGDVQEYSLTRNQLLKFEGALDFGFTSRVRSSSSERHANMIFQKIKDRDLQQVYNTAPWRKGYASQLHPRVFGDHFLSNANLIERTDTFKICRLIPKGAHLHIHSNGNLLPHFLLDIAKTMQAMYIASERPLNPKYLDSDMFGRNKIRFSIMSEDTVATHGGEGDIFSNDYISGQPMRFQSFLHGFRGRWRSYIAGNGFWSRQKAMAREEENPRVFSGHDTDIDVDIWLQQQVVLDEQDAHNLLQTTDGVCEMFNERIQMLDGLSSYETAFRMCIRHSLQEFADDNIQYAEIRHCFAPLWKDDGSGRIDEHGTMNAFIVEYESFQRVHKFRTLKGLKIVYCIPWSYDRERVRMALDTCIELRLRYPGWIAGLGFSGHQLAETTLATYVEEFLWFKKSCKEKKVEIPLLLGGTGMQGAVGDDGDLVDAILLGAKRIGCSFSLQHQPYIIEQVKRRNTCVEIFPIADEVLGLTSRMSGHAVYDLLANNVHCVINTANSTVFRCRLSHAFYQVVAGKVDGTLHDLRQLIEWSIEHSCLEDDRKADIHRDWEMKWDQFCNWVVEEFGHVLDETSVLKL
ncbi:Metallo-dependent hydrolase [Podospora aff. communis PSN243]|uniref:Metallo-dependent hydrolase n=1 Tax=Podospora aff. communis PSN243 TaxID=3040156 RepID=A0AAV9GTL8_9PEZI|nr:Metallo-dependent hydrolase [Podospora aff. communis PSN243]